MSVQLVELPEVERLSPACIRILGGNPSSFTLQGTNTYLVGTGRQRLLIDTAQGMASWEEALRRTLDQENAAIAATLITHWHPDHVGGIDQVRKLAPDAPIYQNRTASASDYKTNHGVEREKDDDDAALGQKDLLDGQCFAVDGATLTAVHTPGHASNHMVFVLGEEGALFAGDNVLGQGTAVYEDLAVYLQSLGKMRDLFSGHGGQLYPGHGPVVADGRAKINEYIAHRQQREDQVVKLLKTDNPASASVSWTPIELTETIYADVRKDLHPAAMKGLVQILDKLEGEGKAVREGQDGWRLKERSPL